MKTLIQGLTLTSFVVLMSTFVLYRGGYFNALLTSPNGGVAPQKGIAVQDTTKKKKHIIGSTKSGRIIEINEPNINNLDTTKSKRLRIMGGSKSGVIFAPTDTTKRKPKIMPSSKSGVIFLPAPVDTTKQKQKIKPKK